jgi:signal transduction histidine kinase
MRLTSIILGIALLSLPAAAQIPRSTQAVALVKRAVAFAKKSGVNALLQEINAPDGKFHVATGGELYIFVYDEHCVVKAIGFNTEALLGKDRTALKDSDGLYFVKEIVNLAINKGKGWVDYKYPNPATNTIEAKTSYVEYYGNLVIGSGIYKE